jgi:hypothetical protein
MRLIAALCFALVSASAAGQEHFLDGKVLYERLQKQDAAAMTYIFGVFDAVQILQYHVPMAERHICPPPGLAGKDLADIVLRHLDADDAARDLPAGVLVLAAFIVRFPCADVKNRG